MRQCDVCARHFEHAAIKGEGLLCDECARERIRLRKLEDARAGMQVFFGEDICLHGSTGQYFVRGAIVLEAAKKLALSDRYKHELVGLAVGEIDALPHRAGELWTWVNEEGPPPANERHRYVMRERPPKPPKARRTVHT